MTDSSWPRVKALFQAAVERPIEDRHAFLIAEAGDDEVLRREVESLLASDALEGSFLDRLPTAQGSVLDDPLASQLASADRSVPHAVLTAGVRVGPYEIVAPLGAGAMGEVYRARDTKLNRDVALKVLPERFALDPDRLARFAREAQVLATLNHPNIAAIYGLEQSSEQGPGVTGSAPRGGQALVLELVDGPTLSDRIAQGPISLGEAITIARQIAEALQAAHEKGIVHRDIKPANIKIASHGVVKVLDFGLAKVWEGAPHANLSTSPNLTGTGVVERTIMGTPAYMSPEQARGQSLDSRTDIWSFGCVFFEMLTGRAPFAADTIADTLAAILEREPDHTMLPADTPVLIRQLLRRCLEKDRERRLDSAARARLAIDDAIASPAAESVALPAPRSSRFIRVAIAALAGGTAIAALVAWALSQPALVAPMLPSRFAIVPPLAQRLNVSGGDRDLALSPDGRLVVYRAGGTGTAGSPLHVRSIDQLDARPLANIGGAYAPFFSPDSRWIGFFESGEIKKVLITGGPVITLGPVSGRSLGASWGDDNSIVFATDERSTGLWRVSADGGEPTRLTTPDGAQPQSDHQFPSVLPDHRGVLFTIAEPGNADNAQVAVLDLTTGQWKTLVRGANQAEYVNDASGSGQGGYLLYATAGTLRAVRFDLARLEVQSDPVTVVEQLMTKPSGAANYAVSRRTALVYVPPEAGDQNPMRSLVWVDRNGREEPLRGAPTRGYGPPRVSPDGKRMAIGIVDQGRTNVWIWDFALETLKPLTSAAGMNGLPVWTLDSQRIIFMSDRTGVLNLYSQTADFTGTAVQITTSASSQWPTSITRDGEWIVAFERRPRMTSSEIVVFPLTSPATRPQSDRARGHWHSLAESIAAIRFNGSWATVSPNGRYLVYQSPESGRNEVYVRPFPEVDRDRWQISKGGGTRAVWARNGLELFYLDESGALISVPVQTSGPRFVAGTSSMIFDTVYAEPNPARHYDVSPDGRRFLMLKDRAADPNATPASMVVVDHWFGGLHWRVPERGK